MKWRSLFLLAILVAVLTGCRGTPHQGAPGRFSFVAIGDTRHYSRIAQPQAYRDNIKQINRIRPRPEFVVNLGDLILGHADRDMTIWEWEEFDRVTAKLKPPLYLVAGNHDVWDEHSLALFIERYGPTYYSFDHRGSHFVILCSELPVEDGHIAGAQLEWLAADLQKHADAEHIFVFLHRPLWVSHRGMARSGWNEHVHPLLAKYGVDVVFASHDHEFKNYGVQDGVQYYVTGGGGAPLVAGAFYHFMLTTVDGAEVSSVVIDTKGNMLPHDVVTAQARTTPSEVRSTVSGAIRNGTLGGKHASVLVWDSHVVELAIPCEEPGLARPNSQ